MSTNTHMLFDLTIAAPRESNNRDPVPVDVPTHPRDPDYYLQDGGTVFLVGGVLFKFPADLLASTGENLKKAIRFRGYCRNILQRDFVLLFDFESLLSNNRPGVCDTNPLEIPDLGARDFRTLLLALMGRPGNVKYMDLLNPAFRLRQAADFMRYINLMITASRFNLYDLASWAFKQVDHFILEAEKFSTTQWDATTLRNLWRAEIMRVGSLWPFVLLAVSSSLSSDRPLDRNSDLNADVCVAFYRDRVNWPAHVSSPILGLVFPFILALGPHSPVWRDKLTQSERSDLYIAYAHLVALETCSNLQLDWIANPKRLSDDYFLQPCEKCSALFTTEWESTFGRIGRLNSLVPAEDMRKITLLPRYRQEFVTRVRLLFCLKGCHNKIIKLVDSAVRDLFFCQIPAAYRAIVP